MAERAPGGDPDGNAIEGVTMLAAEKPPPTVRSLLTTAGPLRCGSCGYEIASYRTLPRCPMCRSLHWEPVARAAPSSEAA